MAPILLTDSPGGFKVHFRKKQVYLSSTFNDLGVFRDAIKRALEPSGVEVEHMERYAAFE
ncbi:hypothetical protein DEH69_26980, partial [Streptomyces sp. PT12]